ncbi:MAG: response regulator [Spirochaetales bacterium]|nr:response regulator [Spirochaetales bacterium]
MNRSAIVCVDDEVIILAALKSELRNAFGNQFQYETATSAALAMELIGELQADSIEVILILSDWLMPVMKGDEFLKQVRERYPGIKAILVTGNADERSLRSVLEDGLVRAVISKPWKAVDLLTLVKECCIPQT